MARVLYRGYSLGAWYYCHASSVYEAVSLLRKQALKKVGKYEFAEGYSKLNDVKRWVKVFK